MPKDKVNSFLLGSHTRSLIFDRQCYKIGIIAPMRCNYVLYFPSATNPRVRRPADLWWVHLFSPNGVPANMANPSR